jgi:hypothetical protein
MPSRRRSFRHGPDPEPEANGEGAEAAGEPVDSEPGAEEAGSEVRKAAESRREAVARRHREEADLICDFLADGIPHTRAEIGEFAREHDISDGALGRIKKERGIRHVRVQPGEENGLGKSTIGWIIPKDE